MGLVQPDIGPAYIEPEVFTHNEGDKKTYRTIVGEHNSEFTDELVLTNSATITWDTGTPGIVRANAVASTSGGGTDPIFTDTEQGEVPASGGGTTNFLRADATWAAPGGGSGITELTGDVTAGPGSGSQAATIPNNTVTYAKMQDVSATSMLLGRATAGAGDVEEIGIGAGLSLLAGNLVAGADPWTYVKVSGSDFTTTSATAVDVTGLTFTPATNTDYEFEATLMIRTATATVNPRVGLGWPSAGVTDGVAQIMESQAATGTPLFASGNFNAALLVAVGGLPNTTQSWPVTIKGMIRQGGSVTGSVRVQLASETAGTTVQVQIGSFLKYRTI